MTPDPARDLLRHTVATLAYRGAKALRDVPDGFASFQAAPDSRSPGAILAHIGDLLDWALGLADGRHVWRADGPGAWHDEVARFHDGLARLDRRLADEAPLACPAGQLFQGPIADALTHVGQIGLLRRLAGGPVRGENYFTASIRTGAVGPDQAAPAVEFD
jgi:hypothetical protein